MDEDRYLFEGLETFERRLRRRAHEVGYLVVWDRTDRGDDTLGRFELTLHHALPYLEEDAGLADVDGDEKDDTETEAAPQLVIDEAEEDTEEVDPFSLEDAPTESASPEDDNDEVRCLRVLGREAGPADFAVAACRWVRDIAVRNMGGDPIRRFRVRAYAPKGTRVVESTAYLCRDDEPDIQLPSITTPEPAMPDLRIPTPSFDQVEVGSATRGMKALGDYYAQWGQLVLGSVGQMQGVNNAMLARVHRDLQGSRDQVDQLVAAILEYRYAEARLHDQRAAADRTDDARHELAKQALSQLGDAAKAFLTAKGIAPEMGETLNLLGQSPELVAALTDPDVRLLMRDPNNLTMLAAMLKHAGQQARAAHDAAAASPPPPPVKG